MASDLDPHSINDELTLVELVNRVLDRGVVINGDLIISLAGVDLVYVGLNLVLTSVETAQRAGRPLPPPPGSGALPG